MSLNSRRNSQTGRKNLMLSSSPPPPPLLPPPQLNEGGRSQWYTLPTATTAWIKRRGSGGNSSGGSRSSVESIGNGLGGGVGLENPYGEENHILNANNNNNDIEPAEYIVDRGTRTTYLKGKFLGKGGFARVHELTDLTTNTVYAGKIIAKSHITQPHHKEKIDREVELQRILKHRHVVQFRHYFEDDLNVYIVLENCSRKSLVHVMKNRGCITEPEVRYYMNQLVDGVQYIHSQNVIHRDLKLGNMFLTDDMVLKIGDFGLATRAEVSKTKRATVCGTPNYIAPEVLNKEGHGFPADIWAIGCIMYTMLVGQPPFETATLKDTYLRIMTNSYVIPPLISSWSSDLIKSLLDSLPSKRPTLDQVRKHDFFNRGYCPNILSPSCCHTTPRFPTNNEYANYEHNIVQVMTNLRVANSPDTSLSSPIYDSVSPTRSTNLNNDCKRVNSANAKSQTKMKSRKSADVYRILTQPSPTSNTSSIKNDKLPRNNSMRELGRKDKDSASLQSCIRQKITSVLCPEKTTTGKKQKVFSVSTLFHVLTTCLDNMPDDVVVNPPCVTNCAIQFVTKWIDYSNKYGFGFQLSDHSVGVLFNDLTRIGFSPDKSRVEFIDLAGKLTVINTNSVPSHLQERFTLLEYFSQYMDENLTEGGETKDVDWGKQKGSIPYMIRWLRTARAIIMQLSTGGLQVNFFQDHTKIILSLDKNQYLVTFINEDRRASTYRLYQITNMGCSSQIRERLMYSLNILKEFSTIDSDYDDW